MFNQPETPLFKKQPFTGHDNVPAMVSLLIESMNKSPVKRSNFISIKVVHGGDRSFLSSMRSKDPSTQVGACIVNEDKRIVGIGYNGFPRGCRSVTS